jgi:hypothetical protein
LSELSLELPKDTPAIKICPLIATYRDKKHKDACIKNINLEADNIEEYKVGATIASATRK